MRDINQTAQDVPDQDGQIEWLKMQLQISEKKRALLEKEVERERARIQIIKRSWTWKTGRLILQPFIQVHQMVHRFRIYIRQILRIHFPLLKPLGPRLMDDITPSNKKVIYTMILGDYDDLKDPETVQSDWDYICFTDRADLTSSVWKIIHVKCPGDLNIKRCAEYFNIYPFKYLSAYKLSISIGGMISIHCDLNDFVRDHLPEDKSLAVPYHPVRNCIYEEAIKVVELNKDVPKTVAKQMMKYRKQGYPVNNGLVQSGVMIRRLDHAGLRRHCKMWLKEILRHSQRDQLSFNYVLWKYRLVEPGFMPAEVLFSSFRIRRHNYRQKYG